MLNRTLEKGRLGEQNISGLSHRKERMYRVAIIC